MPKNEIILYQPEGDIAIEVRLEDKMVWLNRQQMARLFDRDVKTIGKHINNALKEELKDIPTVANFATVQLEGDRSITRMIEYYGIDMVLSVGYRVKSRRGIDFRRWAKHNQQYPPIAIEESPRYHDRFLIIDGTVYHVGASLKDLGKKLFAFSKLEVPAEWLGV